MKKLIYTSILIISIFLVGCSNSKSSNQVQNPTSTSSESSMVMAESKIFTLDELKKNNGQNGNPGYVAVDGVVYDVSKVKEWKDGKHKSGLQAGNDLSKEIGSSPHGKDILKKLPIVGKLK